MDRNLGALDDKYHSNGGKANYYQFGRKDPFHAGGKVWTYDKDTYAATERTGGGRIITSSTTIEETYSTGGDNMPYSVMHPREFISCGSVWTNGQFYNGIVWQDPQISNKLENEETDKSIFDPCPLGWSVPVDGWARGLIGDSSGDATGNPRVNFQMVPNPLNNTSDGSITGRTYYPNGYLVEKDNDNAQKIYYPLSGSMQPHGQVTNIGSSACYWSCNPNTSSGFLFYFRSDAVQQPRSLYRGYGLSVRCIQEK